MTIGEMTSYIERAIGVNDKTADIPTWIYWATLRIAEKHDFDELIQVQEATLPSDTQIINIPDTWKNIYWCAIATLTAGVYSEDNRLIPTAINRIETDYVFPETESTSRPYRYAWRGRELSIIPQSDAEYVIRFRISLWPQFITDTNLSVDYNDKDNLVIAFTLAEAFQAMQMKSDSAYWHTVGNERLKEAISAESHADLSLSLGKVRDTPEVIGDFHSRPFVRSNPSWPL